MSARTLTLFLCLFLIAAFSLLSGCGSESYHDPKTGLTVRKLGSDLDNRWAFKGVVVVESTSPAAGLIDPGELIAYIVDERRVTSKKEFEKALSEALEEDGKAILRISKVVSTKNPGEFGMQVKPDPEERGVIVGIISPGSDAQESGIKRGTIIYKINGKDVKSVEDYSTILAEAGGGKLTFDMSREIIASKLSKARIQVKDQGGAVVVTELAEKKSESNPVGMEGIRVGDVITHVIDEMKITDIKSYKKAIKKATDGSTSIIFKRGELGGIKLAAIDALGQIGDARAIVPLLEALESKDKWVRRAAARALEGMENELIIQPLMGHLLLEDEDDDEVRRSAAKALARMQPEEAIEHLAKALKDTSLGVRLDAGYALGRIGEPAIDVLIKARYDSDSKVRDSAVAALGNIGGELVKGELIGVLRDKNEESTVKLTAIQALYKIGDSESIAELRKVAETGDPGLQAFVKELLTEETL